MDFSFVAGLVTVVGAVGSVAWGLIAWFNRLANRISLLEAVKPGSDQTLEVAVLKANMQSLRERLDGFESRILDALRRIEDKLDDKADRGEPLGR